MSDKKNLQESSLKETLQTDPLVSAQVHPHYISLTPESEKNELQGVELDYKDYIALFIALLQTVFLPIMILMAVLVFLVIILQNLF